ncbi:MAG: DUF4140 domain-containing protein, partial [Myxococcales bacterium]
MTALPLILLTLSAAPRFEEVVVYPDRALVTRVQEVRCGEVATARFEGIPPAVDPASFRATVRGGMADGVRSEQRTREQAFSTQLETLLADQRRLQAELDAL